MAEKLTTLARRLRPFFLNMFDQQLNLYGSLSEGPDIDIVLPFTVGRGGDRLITFDVDAGGSLNRVAEYAPTSAGMTSALAGSAPIVFMHGYTISGNHSIPDGYWLVGNHRDTSILSGQITMRDGSGLVNLSVVRTANDANTLYGVKGSLAGTSYLLDCTIQFSWEPQAEWNIKVRLAMCRRNIGRKAQSIIAKSAEQLSPRSDCPLRLGSLDGPWAARRVPARLVRHARGPDCGRVLIGRSRRR